MNEIDKFIDEELELFCDLCQGRNYFNIFYIRSFFHASALANYIND